MKKFTVTDVNSDRYENIFAFSIENMDTIDECISIFIKKIRLTDLTITVNYRTCRIYPNQGKLYKSRNKLVKITSHKRYVKFYSFISELGSLHLTETQVHQIQQIVRQYQINL